jgi:hypothetical protein
MNSSTVPGRSAFDKRLHSGTTFTVFSLPSLSAEPDIGQQLTAMPLRFSKQSKYLNKKTEIDSIVFASQKEAGYYCELKIKVRAGIVTKFFRQAPYPIFINEKKICTYYADFEVFYANGNHEIIDVKGQRLPVYKLKKKMVEAYYNLKIKEV